MLNWIKNLVVRRRSPARASHLELGARGERAAVEHLRQEAGYRIVATNFVLPLGRGMKNQRINGEIDIVAYDGETLVFVEVKTRTSDEVASPERAVDLRKQRQIARAARRYRQMMRVSEESYRYDVVTVMPDGAGFRIELLPGYFSDSVFRRSRYYDRFSR